MYYDEDLFIQIPFIFSKSCCINDTIYGKKTEKELSENEKNHRQSNQKIQGVFR